MSVGLVAFHYPRPEYREELVRRVRRAAEVGFDYDDRESRPREVFNLSPV